MEKLTIVKIGGNVIDNSEALHGFLQQFSRLSGPLILVHGGGKVATSISQQLGVEAELIEGRRVTDIENLRIVTMVYAGLINKNLVAQLQQFKVNALGLSGADGNLICANKRPVKDIDYGFVGDLQPDSVDAAGLHKLLNQGFVPTFSAITHDGAGQLLNTNADTIASALAIALSNYYDTQLVYCFEKLGVLRDVKDELSVIPEISFAQFRELKEAGVVAEGMLPKLHNAFQAISEGVSQVFIGSAAHLKELNTGTFGTRLLP